MIFSGYKIRHTSHQLIIPLKSQRCFDEALTGKSGVAVQLRPNLIHIKQVLSGQKSQTLGVLKVLVIYYNKTVCPAGGDALSVL